MDEMTLTLNSPITEEQWDAITDVDFDNTDEIYFRTKHGKEVCFVKRKTGKWEPIVVFDGYVDFRCSACHRYRFHNGEMRKKYKYCPNCGTKMEETE
jgi:NADH pyrophosphatase NudC (nudix superfamily)